MPNLIAPSRPASWQSQELCPLFWQTASSIFPVLARRIYIRVAVPINISLRFAQMLKDYPSELEEIFVWSFGKDVLEFCGVAVGKLVTTLWVRFLLCSASTVRGLIVTKIVFTFHCLIAFFEQLFGFSTQLFLASSERLRVGLYTLNTGLTNTNNLNKGIIL